MDYKPIYGEMVVSRYYDPLNNKERHIFSPSKLTVQTNKILDRSQFVSKHNHLRKK